MCYPMAIMAVGAIVSAASTAMTIQNQNEAASQQMEAANLAAEADYQAQTAEEQQINDKSSRDRVARIRQGQRERAKLRTSASDAGVQGASVSKMQMDSFNDQGYDLDATDANAINAKGQNTRGKYKTFATAQSRINEASNNTTGGLAGGLQIASSGMQGASSGYNFGKQLSI